MNIKVMALQRVNPSKTPKPKLKSENCRLGFIEFVHGGNGQGSVFNDP